MIVQRNIRLKWIIQIEGWYFLFFLIYGFTVCVLNSYFYYLAFPASGISVLGIAVAIFYWVLEITKHTIGIGKPELLGVI
jgi:hypothetical protein